MNAAQHSSALIFFWSKIKFLCTIENETYCLYPLSNLSIVHGRANNHKNKCLTSYWVIRPFGSTGSSHFRKIMSSSGVKVSDSGAMPPGTTRNWRDKHLSVKIEVLIPEWAPSCQYRQKKKKKRNERHSHSDSRYKELAGAVGRGQFNLWTASIMQAQHRREKDNISRIHHLHHLSLRVKLY